MTRPAVPVSIRKAGQIHGHRLLLRNATRVDASFIHSLRRHADRARYLSADESLELWTKGPEATLTLLGENETVLYRDCAEVPVEAVEEGTAG